MSAFVSPVSVASRARTRLKSRSSLETATGHQTAGQALPRMSTTKTRVALRRDRAESPRRRTPATAAAPRAPASRPAGRRARSRSPSRRACPVFTGSVDGRAGRPAGVEHRAVRRSPGFQTTPVYWTTAVSPLFMTAPEPFFRSATTQRLRRGVLRERDAGAAVRAEHDRGQAVAHDLVRAVRAGEVGVRTSTTTTTESVGGTPAPRAAGKPWLGGITAASRSPGLRADERLAEAA